MATDVTIREGRLEDATVIATIHAASWQATYRGIMPDPYLDSLTARSRLPMWEQILATPPPRVDVLVLEIDGEVQGFAWTGPAPGADAPGDPGMVYAMYLRPGLEGHGLGRPLLAAGEAALAGQGFLSAVLHVARDNPRARRFYERAGWTPDGEERLGEVQGVPLVELVYKRALPTTSPQGPP